MIYNSDEYLTINSVGTSVYTNKKSRFLGFAHSVNTLEEVKEIIKSYKKKYYDARHICYAYILGVDKKEYRANDDGEPSSTAGKPILGQINSKKLTNILVVVVRYYGGINLGTSGLIEAYRSSAILAIESSEIVIRKIEEFIDFKFSFQSMNHVMRIIKDLDAKIINQDFDNVCRIRLSISKSKSAVLKNKLESII